jgi:hypothetical protein
VGLLQLGAAPQYREAQKGQDEHDRGAEVEQLHGDRQVLAADADAVGELDERRHRPGA